MASFRWLAILGLHGFMWPLWAQTKGQTQTPAPLLISIWGKTVVLHHRLLLETKGVATADPDTCQAPQCDPSSCWTPKSRSSIGAYQLWYRMTLERLANLQKPGGHCPAREIRRTDAISAPHWQAETDSQPGKACKPASGHRNLIVEVRRIDGLEGPQSILPWNFR